VRLYLPASIGSARKARRSGRVEFGIRASGPVHAVRITLDRGGRRLGRATLERIVGRAVVRLRVNRARARSGRVTLTVTARDGQGRPVKATGRPRLAR
jgi:autotransporter translocation and assembly factor TamB